MKLTPGQIQEICDELHERVQFYDEMGNPENGQFEAEIKAQLTAAFIDEPDLEEVRAEQSPTSGEVLIKSPLGTQQLACGNRVPVENPTTIRVE